MAASPSQVAQTGGSSAPALELGPVTEAQRARAEALYENLRTHLYAVTSGDQRDNLDESIRRFVTAHINYEAAGNEVSDYGLLMNFGTSSVDSRRSFLVDTRTGALIHGPMHGAHGSARGAAGRNLSDAQLAADYGSPGSPFGNFPPSAESYRSSLGVFTTFPTDFVHGRSRGHRWGGALYPRDYNTIGLDGRSGPEFNSRARERGVYMHGIPSMGRTQGCPGFTAADWDVISEYMEPPAGSPPAFVMIDAPTPSWHRGDPWLQRSVGLDW